MFSSIPTPICWTTLIRFSTEQSGVKAECVVWQCLESKINCIRVTIHNKTDIIPRKRDQTSFGNILIERYFWQNSVRKLLQNTEHNFDRNGSQPASQGGGEILKSTNDEHYMNSTVYTHEL